MLTSEGHENKSYNIGGETTASFFEIAGYLTEIAGKQINYISPTVEIYKQELAKHNLPEQSIKMVAGFAVAFSENAMDVTSKDFTQLIYIYNKEKEHWDWATCAVRNELGDDRS